MNNQESNNGENSFMIASPLSSTTRQAFSGPGLIAAPQYQNFNPLLQQEMMVRMMAMMQMLFQQLLNPGGNGVLPVAPNFGSETVPGGTGVENFLGTSPSKPATQQDSSKSKSTSGKSKPTSGKLKTEGTEFGKKFAAQAEKTARRINTSGLCLKGVNDTMQRMGIPVKREAAAYMALDDFRNNKRFQEVKVSKDKLKSLPPGAVVIWDKGSGLPYGHISVALGKGREASSIVRDQLLLNTKFHVFLPKEGR